MRLALTLCALAALALLGLDVLCAAPVARPAARPAARPPAVRPAPARPETDPHVAGLLAMRGHFRHVTPQLAARLVAEARAELAKPGNGWIKLHELLGIAVTESDLQWWIRVGLDCGLYQTRVDNWTRKRHEQSALCARISGSSALSVEYALRELNRIRARYCTDAVVARLHRWSGRTGNPGRISLLNCVYNVYNQGPARATTYPSAVCAMKWRGARIESWARYARVKEKCKRRRSYWLRALCFAAGAKLGKRARWSCRQAQSVGWIGRAYSVKRLPF